MFNLSAHNIHYINYKIYVTCAMWGTHWYSMADDPETVRKASGNEKVK